MVRVRFGPFELDSESRRLLEDGADVHLTPKAFDLLVLLVAEAPRVIPKDELHRRLWADTFVSDATLTGLVKQLRRALDDRDARTPLVRTVHGVGFGFGGELRAFDSELSGISRWVVVAAARIVLKDGENVVGRDPSAVVRLDAAGVSRRHACILVDGNVATIRDLDSKNGTFVNDRTASSPIVLRDGDRIQAGPAVLVYHESTSGMSTETIIR